MGFRRLPFARQLGMSVLAIAWLGTPSASAQTPPDTYDAPAHLAYVDGAATLDRDGQAQAATSGMPLIPGDRVRTTAGRVEVLFPDGSAFDADEHSAFELLSPTLIRVTMGRVLLIVTGSNDPTGAVRYQIDTPPASAFSDGPGEYRVAIYSSGGTIEAELAVLRGYAAFSTDFGSVAIAAGERSLARDNAAPSAPLRFNSARYDAFERWTATRRDERTGVSSAQYLPRDLQMYGGTFDRYGSWSYEPDYGNVWYPTVAADWRPYYHGYWSPIRSYGWTWIGSDTWGYPTHHYGRWGHARSRWFWIPERRWAPAWVSWASAPGYVSWCPLGFNNRPVFNLSVSIGNRWNGWTVFPRNQFGVHGYHVNRYAVQPRHIATAAPFVIQASAPVPAPRAVPRSAPRAVPRDGRSVAAAGSPQAVDNAAPRAGAGTRQAPFASVRSAVATRRAVTQPSGVGNDAPSIGLPSTAGRAASAIRRAPAGASATPGGVDAAAGRPSAVRRSGIAAAVPTNPEAAARSPERAPYAPSGNATSRQARPRWDPSLGAPAVAPSAPASAPEPIVMPNGRSVRGALQNGVPRSTPADAAPPQVARPSRVPPQAMPRYGAPSAPSTPPPAAARPADASPPPPAAAAPPRQERAPAAVPRGAARESGANAPAQPPASGGGGAVRHSPGSRRPR